MTSTINLDLVDTLAMTFLIVGVSLFCLGVVIDSRDLHAFVQMFVDEWTPGFVIDGLLLLVVNRIIRRNERKNVLAQVGSLSNDFALDAVRRARSERWLEDGSMQNQCLRRARLCSADLSAVDFAGVDLRFADLADACLTYANLRGADLTGTTLVDVDLRWADLRGATLRWSDLQGARLDGAIIDDADFAFASVDQDVANIVQCNKVVLGGHLQKQQVHILQKTFRDIECAGDVVVETFYNKLFKAKPQLESMFSSSKTRQQRKFLQSLKVLIMSLDEPERSIEMLEQLGLRHASYGVKEEHYELAGAVLMSTLAEFFAERFTQSVEEAWGCAFALIASVMVQYQS